MVTIDLVGTKAKGYPSIEVEIEGVSKEAYNKIRANLRSKAKQMGATEGIVAAFFYAIQICPKANPSDLWLYTIYREYLESVGNEQSWKRASGYAFERVIERYYNPYLERRGYSITCLKKAEARLLLKEFGLTEIEIPIAKLDMSLYRQREQRTIAVVHAKVSVAERISDDAPASRRLMEAGCKSAILTMDMKHFPPPHGNGVNYGELGGRLVASGIEREYQQKRAYIEESGNFDALFSYNLRTPPSQGNTTSGKKIYTLSFSEPQPDLFVRWVYSLE